MESLRQRKNSHSVGRERTRNIQTRLEARKGTEKVGRWLREHIHLPQITCIQQTHRGLGAGLAKSWGQRRCACTSGLHSCCLCKLGTPSQIRGGDKGPERLSDCSMVTQHWNSWLPTITSHSTEYFLPTTHGGFSFCHFMDKGNGDSELPGQGRDSTLYQTLS